MIKKYTLIIITLIFAIIGLSGCGKSQESVSASKMKKDTTQGVECYEFQEINEFNEKFKEIFKIENQNFVRVESKLFKGDYYKLSIEPTNYMYIGELKENLPDGMGVLFDIIDNDGTFIISIKYKGYFEEGRFNGYGRYFGKATDYSDYYEELERVGTKFLEYEGYFKNGEYEGIGNKYKVDNKLIFDEEENMYLIGDLKKYILENKSALEEYAKTLENAGGQPVFWDLPLLNSILEYSGEFSGNEYDGKGMLYSNSKLIYKGEFSDDEINGEGILYYESGKIKYEGSLKDNTYHGKGTLYNEDGSVKYKGDWKKGEPK